MRASRRVGALTALLIITGCGGGGTTEDGNTFGRPLPAGNIEGTLQYWRSDVLAIEREPNDTAAQAQRLPDVYSGQARAAYGRLDVPNGDVVDSFRLRAPQRVTVIARLAFGASNDFDLALYDPMSMQFIRSPDATGVMEFHARGVFDLVVIGNSGAGGYELFYQINATPALITAEEPNDDVSSAVVLGEIRRGEELTIDGFHQLPQDARDTMLLSCPEDALIQFHLTIPNFSEVELRISDATSDLNAPDPIVTLDGAPSEPRIGSVAVSAGTLLLVECVAQVTGGPWRLLTSSQQPASSKFVPRASISTAAPPRVASLSREGAWLRDSIRYGVVGPAVDGQALVCFCEDAQAAGVACAQARGCSVDASSPHVCVVDFDLPSGLTAEERARQTFARCCNLAGPDCVRYAEPNHIVKPTLLSNDPLLDLQAWAHEMINLPNAWGLTTGSDDTIVAVVDSGSILHFDLTARNIGGFDFVSDPVSAGDGGGRDSDPTDMFARVFDGHGALVAGVIAASSNNELGIAGVTWATRVMHVRVLGVGLLGYSGTVADVSNGIRYAARLPNISGTLPPERADIMNLSLGQFAFSQTLSDACGAARDAGVTLIAAAGNSNGDIPFYPAALESVISVSATNLSRERASYSSFGPTVALTAPGGDFNDADEDGFADLVLSTALDDDGRQVYIGVAGTSLAAPHVSGVAALILAINPALTPNAVESILTTTAVDLGPAGRDDEFGHGLVDALAAVRQAIATKPPDPVAPPDVAVLDVHPGHLNFLSKITGRSLYIRNAGGIDLGRLEVSGVTVTTEDGGGWLRATPIGFGDTTRNFDEVLVQVDRTGLGAGQFFGNVSVHSNGGDIDIPVYMQSNVALPPLPNIDIHLQAISAETGEVVQTRIINLAATTDFSFRALPIGSYIFRASSDIDGDGVLCEQGDVCGEFPILGDPQTVRVYQNITRSDIRFDVARRTAIAEPGDN